MVKRKKVHKLIMLAFGYNMCAAIKRAEKNALCEEGCPVFEKCPQNTSKMTQQEVERYCTNKIKNWWYSYGE